jgi:hypothetical protein
MAGETDPRMQRLVDAFVAESRLVGAVALDADVVYGIVSQLVRATCADKGVTIDSALDDILSVDVVKGLVRLGAAEMEEAAPPTTRPVDVPAGLCGEVVSGLAQAVTRTTQAAANYSVPLHRATGTLLAAAGVLATFGAALSRAAGGAGPQPAGPSPVTVPLGDLRQAVTVLDACAVVIAEPLAFGRRSDEDGAQRLAVVLERTARRLAETGGPAALPR